jgi:hypothetical protein
VKIWIGWFPILDVEKPLGLSQFGFSADFVQL